MDLKNKPAQRLRRNLTSYTIDDWECNTTNDDLVVCSSTSCHKKSSSLQLDVLQQVDHDSSTTAPTRRYVPLSFTQTSNANRSAAMVVDCRDEQYIAYGDHTKPVSRISAAQFVMGVSSSLPSLGCSSDKSHDMIKGKSHDPIKEKSRDQIKEKLHDAITVLSDCEEDMDTEHHVTSGECSLQRTPIKRKRRKLINTSLLQQQSPISNWQPEPVTVKGSADHLVITADDPCISARVKRNDSLSSSCDLLISAENATLSPTVTEHELTRSCVVSSCDRNSKVNLIGTPVSKSLCSNSTITSSASNRAVTTSDHNSKVNTSVSKSSLSATDRGVTTSQSSSDEVEPFTRRPLLTSVRSNTFYSYNYPRSYPSFGKSRKTSGTDNQKSSLNIFSVQSRLRGYTIPRKQSPRQHSEENATRQLGKSLVATDNDASDAMLSHDQTNTHMSSPNQHKEKNFYQSSLLDALSQLDQSHNNIHGVELNSAGLEIRSPIGQFPEASLSPVQLDCSRASVGSLAGIAEGAILAADSLSFNLEHANGSHHIVISPLVDAVQCCKINLQRQPYIIQLKLYTAPGRTMLRKAMLNSLVYDTESRDSRLHFVRLWFDLKPSTETGGCIDKILKKLSSDSKIGWAIEHDTISSDEVENTFTTTNMKRLPLKRYATRSKNVSSLKAIKDNYNISDDEVDVGDNDEDFDLLPSKSTVTTKSSSRRSTRLSSFRKQVKPEDDKLLLSYRPGSLARAVSIFLSDLECLEEGEFLNDKIIDFYLKYLWYDKLSDDDNRSRVHVFSPFFHTRLVNNSFGGGKKGSQYDPELLHSRVKNWTKNVDLFSKELVILPVCQRSHWFVAVICRPGSFEATSSSNKTISLLSPTLAAKGDEMSDDVIDGVLEHSSSLPIPDAVEQTGNHSNSYLRPCILILDSLGIPRSNTIAKIKRYLTAEWKHKHHNKQEKDFSTFVVLSHSKLKVPLQENYSDCGLFVLQYVDVLLQRVIVDNCPVPKTSEEWFSLNVISKMRNYLHTLITTLSTAAQIT